MHCESTCCPCAHCDCREHAQSSAWIRNESIDFSSGTSIEGFGSGWYIVPVGAIADEVSVEDVEGGWKGNELTVVALLYFKGV